MPDTVILYMDTFFLIITWLGSLYVLLPAALLLVILFRSAGRVSDFILLVGGLLGTSVIVHGLKILFARPRPPAENLLVIMPSDFSFPSAHAAQVTAFACACALILAKRQPTRKIIPLWTGLAVPVLLVGISRVYLQVHYLSDVLAGALTGVLWILSLHWLLNLSHDKA